jgi:hypothetical protein
MASTDTPDTPDIPGDTPTIYEVRVRGAFDESWRELIDGMTLDVVHDGLQTVTVLRLVVQDQAALAGLMDVLFGVNATVLSVTALEAASSSWSQESS